MGHGGARPLLALLALAGGALLAVGASACAGPQVTQAAALGSATKPPDGIAADGNRLVDRAGQRVTLRGVNMSGTEYACAQNHSDDPFGGQPEASPRTWAAMRAWHINVVRLPLNEDCWLGINGARVGGSAYRGAIEGLVRGLEDSGFYVILDLHWSAPGSQLALAQNPAPDEDHSPAFWASVAETFGHDRNVIFDLFNEPYFRWLAQGSPSQWDCLWHGCTETRYATGGEPATVAADWRTAGMDQLIRTVRRAGSRNLLLVAGLRWANDLSGWLKGRPHDADLAVSWHSYPDNRCADEKCWQRQVAPLAARVPVLLTETGDRTEAPARYLPRLLPWCDRHQIGYLAWTWNAWAKASNVLVTNMETGAPTPGEGAYFKQHLLQLWRQERR